MLERTRRCQVRRRALGPDLYLYCDDGVGSCSAPLRAQQAPADDDRHPALPAGRVQLVPPSLHRHDGGVVHQPGQSGKFGDDISPYCVGASAESEERLTATSQPREATSGSVAAPMPHLALQKSRTEAGLAVISRLWEAWTAPDAWSRRAGRPRPRPVRRNSLHGCQCPCQPVPNSSMHSRDWTNWPGICFKSRQTLN